MKKTKVWLILGVITLVGFVLRIMCCFWGFPYVLQGDEHVIVNGAIDMIRRKSYLMYCFNRPDQFETKICAVLFQIVSYLKYGMSAHEAVADHLGVFHLIARGFTACWGTLMIPLGYLILEKCRKNTGLLGAILIALFPIFIQHSAYATPDIVLTFFGMAVTYIAMLYMENPSWKKLALMAVCCGISITIKYPGAIFCIWVAAVVMISCIQRKKYMEILTSGLFCIAIVFLVFFAIAPELVIEIDKTIDGVILEATDDHLGADGLNMWQNALYYLRLFVETLGYESALFLLLGFIYCLKEKNAAFNMACGFVFWLCISFLALHWERWGMPIYVYWIMMVVLGFYMAIDLIKKLKTVKLQKICTTAANLLIGLVIASTALSGLWIVRYSLMKDSRVAGKIFCDANGIIEGNTVYDGYSPLEMQGSTTIPVGIDPNGNFMVPPRTYGVQFLIISSGMYDRFYAEPERYAGIVANYDRIRTFEKIYESQVYEFHSANWCVSKIWWKTYDIICSQGKCIGPTIEIYRY